MANAQERYKRFGTYSSFRVDYTPTRRSDTESWYTIQPGETDVEVQAAMEKRYPSDRGYTFTRVDSIPKGERVIEP